MFKQFENLFFNSFVDDFNDVVDKVTIPMNIIHEEDGSATIELAVVGKSEKDIKVSGTTEDDKTFLIIETVEQEKTEDEKQAEEKREYSIRKIKGTGKLTAKILVPARLDLSKAVKTVENGLLTIKIPVAEKAKPVTFEI